MTEVVVTRSGQITLTKNVREKAKVSEGDIVVVNVIGNTITISKKNIVAFDRRNFLPGNFEKTLTEMRHASSWSKRLKRLGIVE